MYTIQPTQRREWQYQPSILFPFLPGTALGKSRIAAGLQGCPSPLPHGNSLLTALAEPLEAFFPSRRETLQEHSNCLGLGLTACGGHLFTGCGEAQSCLRNDLEGSSLGCLATSKQGLVVFCPSSGWGLGGGQRLNRFPWDEGVRQGGVKDPGPPVELTLQLLGVTKYTVPRAPALQVILKSTGTLLSEDPASRRDPMPVSAFACEFQKARRDAAGSC